MNFINTPLTYINDTHKITRSIKDRQLIIDNLIELIVFTPRGSFVADPDFGFEYWNHEYSNIHFRDFNNGQNMSYVNGLYNEITRKECQDSVKKSLEVYEHQLKQIDVSIELRPIDYNTIIRDKLSSKYEIVVVVTGMLDDGLGTFIPYNKNISFLMEPTVKRINI